MCFAPPSSQALRRSSSLTIIPRECLPSAEDFAFTKAVRAGGRILGVSVLDHVIVALNGFYSFLDAGEMKPLPEEGL